ncbi:MAG: M1 family aminopeptidase [Gemmatimonadaceae bacterium]
MEYRRHSTPSLRPNRSAIYDSFRDSIKGIAICAALAFSTACARAANPPAPAPVEVSEPSGPGNLELFQMDTAATLVDLVPPFEPGPLVSWGPAPAGASHAERVRTYDLQHQAVTVRFDWTRQAVVGTTTLRIGTLDSAAVSDVRLDAVDMTFAGVRDEKAPLKYDYDGRILTVHLPQPLRAGGQTSITIDYDGINRTKGVYFRPEKHIVWTQSEAEDARYWIPTYDDPNDKTTWEFFIWTAKDERALSNGRLAGSRPVGDSIEWHWVLDKPASTYLMTTVVGKYVVIQDKPWRNVSIGYWTYPDSVEAARRGFAKTPAAVDVFSRKTGVAYPWAKYDQIVIPGFQFGGMENVTATSQNDTEILHPAWSEPQANSDDLVSHELAHQWYGDLLTIRWWPDAWLNEGFATFMEEIFHEEDKGADEGAFERFDAHQQSIAADRRARRPLVYDKWVNEPFELFFSGHIYPKGATVLQMLRHQLGDSLFWKAMNHYTTKHAYGNVVTADLRVAFEETTGRDLKPFFDQWVYRGGFPVFQVSSSYDQPTRHLTVSAREVQPRDDATGFFDVDVDVEARTDSGVVRFVVPVRNGAGQETATLKAAPRSVRWDKGDWILDIADFPRSTNMMRYQLTHDDDVVGRIEAVDVLTDRPADPAALSALIASARNDRFWGVRARAVTALAAWASAPNRVGIPPMRNVRTALMTATRDIDARVRQAAVTGLGRIATEVTVPLTLTTRLREIARSDQSLIVRAAALASDIRLEKNGAVPLATQLMAPDVWQNVIRSAAIEALKEVGTPEALELAQKYAPVP